MQRLVNVEELKKLKAAYCRLIDCKQWDELTLLFTPNARFEGFKIVEDPTSASDFVDQLSARLSGSLTVHHCHTPEIVIRPDGTAKGIWAMTHWVEFTKPTDLFQHPEATGFRGYGFYEEQYQRLDGTWRISLMRLARTRVDPLVEVRRASGFDPFSLAGTFARPDVRWLAD
ncbi:nuclear transport factor 2 family protein [Bacillus sp. NP157]|nr:nuclear transport factor 2 family protein [Bacillus sp. NP157]